MKVSRSGAPVNTGRGLEDVKGRIAAAFAAIRQEPATPPAPAPVPMVETAQVYTEEHSLRFQARTKKLEFAALTKSAPATRPKCSAWEIEVPKDTAEILIAKAMRGFE